MEVSTKIQTNNTMKYKTKKFNILEVNKKSDKTGIYYSKEIMIKTINDMVFPFYCFMINENSLTHFIDNAFINEENKLVFEITPLDSTMNNLFSSFGDVLDPVLEGEVMFEKDEKIIKVFNLKNVRFNMLDKRVKPEGSV